MAQATFMTVCDSCRMMRRVPLNVHICVQCTRDAVRAWARAVHDGDEQAIDHVGGDGKPGTVKR